jgi:hypothetical protein
MTKRAKIQQLLSLMQNPAPLPDLSPADMQWLTDHGFKIDSYQKGYACVIYFNDESKKADPIHEKLNDDKVAFFHINVIQP